MTLEEQVKMLREALLTWEWAHHDPCWSPDDARRAKALKLTVAALAATAEPTTPVPGFCRHLVSTNITCSACAAEPAPEFNPLTCPIIPGDFNGPHEPLPWSKEAEMMESWTSRPPTYSVDDLRKVAVAGWWSGWCACGGLRDDADTHPRLEEDLDAIIAEAVGS